MIKTLRMDNGARAFVDTVRGAGATYIIARIGVGSGHEGEDEHGIAHFLEHMMFHNGGITPVTQRFAAIGATINASTSTDETNYYVTVSHDRVAEAIVLLAEVLTADHLTSAEVDKEREIVLRELETRGSNIHWENFTEAAFGGHPITRPTIGTEESIDELDAYQVLEFRERHYVAANMTVGIVGDVDSEMGLGLLEAAFGGHTAGQQTEMEPIPYVGGERHEPCRCSRGNIYFGLKLSDRGSPFEAAEDLLCYLLGGSAASRLFTELREKRGLAYQVDADVREFGHRRLLLVDVDGESTATRAMLEGAYNVIRDVADGLSEEEVRQSIALMTTEFGGYWDTLAYRCRLVADELALDDKVECFADYAARLRSVTAAEVVEAARTSLASPLTLAVHGKKRTLASLDDLEPAQPLVSAA